MRAGHQRRPDHRPAAEEVPNPYITPALNFRFHYFALRKMHFMMRAKALVAFPGGFGTLTSCLR
jgi:predicted Rossmann-fold nucleotide-binding protein